MKTWKIAIPLAIAATTVVLLSFTSPKKRLNFSTFRSIPKGCVFRTVMGEESSGSASRDVTPDKVIVALDKGLDWIATAQTNSGGWGAGSHNRQDLMDPHAVQADPATTAMVGMALLRNGNSLNAGKYSNQLKRALTFILNTVESAPAQSFTITDITGTQIQTKLGANIDVILTSQFLSNLLDGYLNHDPNLQARIKRANNICVEKIQKGQDNNGSFRGSGWAGVLQSSFATNALEAAQAQGMKVDDGVLDKAREFQKGNYDAKSGDVKTEMGAGVMLYAVTGSARASAKEARQVNESMKKAIEEGKLAKNAPPSAANLEKIGYAKDEAMKLSTSFEVYESAKSKAQQDEVMDGFGSNGGEEFLSYLQTGESMIIGKDQSWKNWYDNISGRMLNIQNDDGSWSGHHCITSPVFCTATCLLILSVNNDVDKLTKVGGR